MPNATGVVEDRRLEKSPPLSVDGSSFFLISPGELTYLPSKLSYI